MVYLESQTIAHFLFILNKSDTLILKNSLIWVGLFLFFHISQEGFDPVDSFETVLDRIIRLSRLVLPVVLKCTFSQRGYKCQKQNLRYHPLLWVCWWRDSMAYNPLPRSLLSQTHQPLWSIFLLRYESNQYVIPTYGPIVLWFLMVTLSTVSAISFRNVCKLVPLEAH